jgi:hypothetical protein
MLELGESPLLRAESDRRAQGRRAARSEETLMPRSRRRTGVRKGKTQTQIEKAKRHHRRLDQQAVHAARITREAKARREADDDKYANYPGNR